MVSSSNGGWAHPVLREKTFRVPVSEVYGPVIQGEGMLIGKPTVFVRLGGCDYRCSWCDSLYAVLPEHRGEWVQTDVRSVALTAAGLFPVGSLHRHVTLSGGNPAIQPAGGELVRALHDHRIRVAIETQGSICPDWLGLVDDVTLSPKPPSSGNTTDYGPESPLAKCLKVTKNHNVALGTTRCLKVVAFDDTDYAYAVDVHRAYPDLPFFLQAGTNVGVATRDDLCDALVALQDRVLSDPLMQDVAVLPQLHAVLKGHARGI